MIIRGLTLLSLFSKTTAPQTENDDLEIKSSNKRQVKELDLIRHSVLPSEHLITANPGLPERQRLRVLSPWCVQTPQIYMHDLGSHSTREVGIAGPVSSVRMRSQGKIKPPA